MRVQWNKDLIKISLAPRLSLPGTARPGLQTGTLERVPTQARLSVSRDLLGTQFLPS